MTTRHNDADGTSIFDRSEPSVSARPIPTMLEGVTYRSRLEARWAVFFDALGIRALYEHEAYEFEDGTRYLPDFWLPSLKLFIEVKPTAPTSEEIHKCALLASGTGHRVVMVIGAPGDWLDAPAPDECSMRFWCDGSGDWGHLPCECPHCHAIDWQYEGRADRIKCDCPKSSHGDKGRTADAKRIVTAAKLANAVNLGIR